MEIKKKSHFKNSKDIQWLDSWVKKLEVANDRNYESITIETSLGKTHVWGLNTTESDLETLVIFPGARTTSLFWDFDRGLDHLNIKLRIYMVETNGLPNFSDGNTPEITSLGYGKWASEVMGKLNIDKAFVAGASFGGLVCMKLAIVSPEKVKAAFLLNPGCLQPFSLKAKNLYYNLLPLIWPKPKNVKLFLDKAVFCKPNHRLSENAEQMIIDYELFAITRYNDNTQKPYYMNAELSEVKIPTYLILGDRDLLFPFQSSIKNANQKLRNLKETKVFGNVRHGIETYNKALNYMGDTIKKQ